MKSHTKYLTFKTRRHREYINITDDIESAVEESGVSEGIVLVSTTQIKLHTSFRISWLARDTAWC